MTKNELIEQLEILIQGETDTSPEDAIEQMKNYIDQFIESERSYFDQEYRSMTHKIKDYVESELDSFTDDFQFGVE